MKVTRGHSFADEQIGAITASKKQRWLRIAALIMLLGWAIAGVGMLGFAAAVIRNFWARGYHEAHKVMEVGIVFFAIAFGGLVAFTIGSIILSLYGYKKRRVDLRDLLDLWQGNASRWKAGKWGEDRVLHHLAGRLNDQWRAFTNVSFHGMKGDADLVLVGPKGVYAVEVKNWVGRIMYQDGSGWTRVRDGETESLKDPAYQAVQNAQTLRQLVNEEVIPVVVFAHPKSAYVGDHPTVEVHTLETFVPWLQSQPDRLTSPEVESVAFTIEQVMKKE